jgi:hypothetical protein
LRYFEKEYRALLEKAPAAGAAPANSAKTVALEVAP